MQATLARLELTPPSWEQVGGWLAALAVAAGGIAAGFKGNWKGPQIPKPVEAPPPPLSATADQPSPIAVLGELIHQLQVENERVREEVKEQDTGMKSLRRQIGEQDLALRDLRRQLGEQDGAIQRLQGQIRAYRRTLVQNGIDPGDG